MGLYCSLSDYDKKRPVLKTSTESTSLKPEKSYIKGVMDIRPGCKRSRPKLTAGPVGPALPSLPRAPCEQRTQ